MKWLVDSMGIDELRERIFRSASSCAARATGRGASRSTCARSATRPRAARPRPPRSAPRTFRSSCSRAIRTSVGKKRTSCAASPSGTVSAVAYSRLGDITADQFRALADIQRDFELDIRITNRQNFALRDLNEADVRPLYDRLNDIGMAEAGAELARDVVSCPGADTCNLAVTQSRGLAAAIGDALEDAGLAEVPGVRVEHLRLHEQLRPAPHLRHRVLRARAPGARTRRARLPDAARRAPRRHEVRVRREGHQGAGQERARSGRAGRAAASTRSARPGETFQTWLARSGGAKGVGDTLTDLDHFPTPDVGPEFYVDYDETGPYVAEVGDGECAAT